ncbi:hypothetical protein [Mycetocola sp. JXN-3]|uniref:hypothetical protein n=1 Tax=Mycetocola sp. JXN-3 TaxID=2116510 RepID=UPI00165D1550|nr:hypothetical protein [Mycetocola sp. JXN-3]
MTTPEAVPAPLKIPVPVPSDAQQLVHSATIMLGDTHLLTSWGEGRETTRAGLLDLRSGEWRILTGLRAPIAAGFALSPERALVITYFGLYEIDLPTVKIARKLTAKIGKYNFRLTRIDENTVAVGSKGVMETLVSLDTLTALRRRRRGTEPAPTIPEAAARRGVRRVLHSDAELFIGATGESFHVGAERVVILATGDQRELFSMDIPFGVASAFRALDGVTIAPTDLGRAHNLLAIPGLPAESPWHIEPAAPSWGEIPVPGDVSTLPSPGELSIAPEPGVHTLTELARAAEVSARELLATAARKNPPRLMIRDQRIAEGTVLSDLSASHFTLENCRSDRSTDASRRPRLVRATLGDVELRRSSINGAVLEDVVIDGLNCGRDDGFVFGVEFTRVTLRGRIQGLVLNTTMRGGDPEIEAAYEGFRRARFADPEWMLDITEATGSFELRGFPSRFIRRNPALHAVVSAEATANGAWESIDRGGSALWVSISELAHYEAEDVVLVADSHGPRARADLEYIRRLRDAGIAAPD